MITMDYLTIAKLKPLKIKNSRSLGSQVCRKCLRDLDIYSISLQLSKFNHHPEPSIYESAPVDSN